MGEVQQMRIVRSGADTTTMVIGTIIYLGAVYYLMFPGRVMAYLARIRSAIDGVKYWISVQNTLLGIRNLPETRNSCNT
jgi:hypothetical protein